MSDPIGALALRNLQGIGDGPRAITIDIGKGDGPSFGDTLKRALGEVSSAQDDATERDRGRIRADAMHARGKGGPIAEQQGHRDLVAADGTSAPQDQLDREAGEVHERNRAAWYRDALRGKRRRCCRVERLCRAAVALDGDLELLRRAVPTRATADQRDHVLRRARGISLHELPHLLRRGPHP